MENVPIYQTKEIRACIEIAGATFTKMKKYLTYRDIRLELRVKLLHLLNYIIWC